jgi:type IV pilus assembly protein PilY1
MAIGRVIIGGYEKWVGFIGGGYNNDNDPNKGKGFFVVDLRDGGVLWSFTRGSGDSRTTSSHMTYSIPASPAVVDTDNDGFIDTAYVGDLGGNMWRFKFCTEADTSSCNTGNWSGGLLFQATTGFIQPIYTTAAVARGSIWVFWGTGNKENPAGSSGMDHFFALQDNDPTATYTIGYFQDITTEGTTYSGAQNGWYITLSAGEKMLSDPTVFGGIVLFTTYTPTTSSSDLCTNIGTGKLYALAMMRIAIGLGGYKYDPGAGVLSTPGSPGSTAGGARGITLGSGVVKGPIISQKLAGGPTDLYVSLSGGGGQDTKIIPITSSAQLQSSPLAQRFAQTAPSTQLLHWKDGRIQ